jgi:hypothetical protein
MLRRWSSLYAVLSSCFAEITYGLLRAESSWDVVEGGTQVPSRDILTWKIGKEEREA